jgi:hypothetical protein
MDSDDVHRPRMSRFSYVMRLLEHTGSSRGHTRSPNLTHTREIAMPGTEQSWIADMRQRAEAVLYGPPPTGSELATLQARVAHARRSATVMQGLATRSHNPVAAARIARAATMMRSIETGLGHLQTARELAELYTALTALERIGPVSNNPQAAAVAFGQLFVALGALCRFLPPPLDSYGEFLSQMGPFFSNVIDAWAPDRRARTQELDREGRAAMHNGSIH